MATKEELKEVLKEAVQELRGEQNLEKTLSKPHKAEPIRVSCPECETKFKVCKDCGGSIETEEDEEETEESETDE